LNLTEGRIAGPCPPIDMIFLRDTTMKKKGIGLGIGLGAALGVTLGVLAGHVALWLGVGVAIGMALGSTLRRRTCAQCEAAKKNQELVARG